VIPKHPTAVEVGDYVKFRGHGIREFLYLQWWKVTDVEGGAILLVDRHRKTARVSIEQARRANWRVLVWECGDDRGDEDPAVLDNWRAATGRRR
jgi:hypothetical protein